MANKKLLAVAGLVGYGWVATVFTGAVHIYWSEDWATVLIVCHMIAFLGAVIYLILLPEGWD